MNLRRLLATGTAALFSASLAGASMIMIQPIQVCNDTGLSCANAGQELFAEAGNKIWAQAGLSLDFLSFTTFSSTLYQNLSESSAATFGGLTGAGHGQNADPLVIDMWFVNSISGAYGEGWLGGNGIAIGDNVFSDGRLDTIAHELGHNLGLDHYDTSDYALYLMASGGVRTAPGSLSDITPDGLGTDRLSSTEIATVLGSPFVLDAAVPEPGTMALTFTVLALFAGFGVKLRGEPVFTGARWKSSRSLSASR
jgi:hypothetical protein